MLSKTITVTFPAALLIWLWWRGELNWRAALPLAPFFLLALGISLMDVHLAHLRRPHPLPYTHLDRLLIASRAVIFYLSKLFWPTRLATI